MFARRFTLVTLICFLLRVGIASAHLAPIYSHHHFGHPTVVIPKGVSAWVVRPVDWHDDDVPEVKLLREDGSPYVGGERKQILADKRIESLKLAKYAYEFAERSYKGIYDEDVRALLEGIKSGLWSFVLITEEGHPEHIYQMTSIVSDSPQGLLVERHLAKYGLDRLERPKPYVLWIPEQNFNTKGPTNIRIAPTDKMFWWYQSRMQRRWAMGGVIEMKTTIRSEDCPEDFLPLTMQIIVAHQLVRWTRDPVPADIVRELPPPEVVAYYQWIASSYRVLGPDGHEWHHQEDMPHFLAPLLVPYLRTARIYGDVPVLKLADTYVNDFKFNKDHPWQGPDHHGNVLTAVQVEVPHFEEETWAALKKREGGRLLMGGSLDPRDGPPGWSPGCVEWISPDIMATSRYMAELETQRGSLQRKIDAFHLREEMRFYGATTIEQYVERKLAAFE